MIASTPRAELAQAIRLVNLRYSKLTEEQQRRVEIIPMDAIDDALREGDDDRAYAVIAGWCGEQITAIQEVSR